MGSRFQLVVRPAESTVGRGCSASGAAGRQGRFTGFDGNTPRQPLLPQWDSPLRADLRGLPHGPTVSVWILHSSSNFQKVLENSADPSFQSCLTLWTVATARDILQVGTSPAGPNQTPFSWA